MKLSKLFIFRDNLIIKLSNVASKSLSLISSIISLKRNYRIIDWKQKSYAYGYGMTKCMCYLEEVSEIDEIIYKDKL